MRLACLAMVLLATAGAAAAQLRLPGLPALPDAVDRLRVPPRPALPDPSPVLQDSTAALVTARREAVQQLLREQRERVEPDPAGAPVRRGELLLIDPSAALLQAALAEGYRLLRETVLDALDLRQVVLAPPAGVALAAALARLRALDPALEADYHHLYQSSAAASAAAVGIPAMPPAVPATAGASSTPRRVGLIDGGVDGSHPALRATPLQRWGCAGAATASLHGTAVASLLVGGALRRDGLLYVADVYCGAPDGGGVEAVAQALAWLVRERVAVINISLVGPANRLLERSIAAATARGHIVVAAVGNDGPAAPPLFPAAYDGVVGVTAVGPGAVVLPEAVQGPQVMFAAPGAGLQAARSGGRGLLDVRGTSFAAPLVAGLLAERLARPDPAAREQALRALVAAARDLGAPGRDAVYGHGLVADDAIARAAR